MNTFDSSQHPREASGQFIRKLYGEDPTVALGHSGNDPEAMSNIAAQAVLEAMCDGSVTLEDEGAGIRLVLGSYEGAALTASCPAGNGTSSSKWQCSLDGQQHLEHPSFDAGTDPGEVAQWLYEVREELGVSQPDYRAAW